MAANSRFAVAAHILAALAHADQGGLLTSAYLASSVNTHPVVVRRMVSDLVRAGLVRAVPGKGGGFHLGRPARSISLWDVMVAVDGCTVFAVNPNPANPRCPVSVRMGRVLEPELARARSAVERSLRGRKIADLLRGLASTEPRARPGGRAFPTTILVRR